MKVSREEVNELLKDMQKNAHIDLVRFSKRWKLVKQALTQPQPISKEVEEAVSIRGDNYWCLNHPNEPYYHITESNYNTIKAHIQSQTNVINEIKEVYKEMMIDVNDENDIHYSDVLSLGQIIAKYEEEKNETN